MTKEVKLEVENMRQRFFFTSINLQYLDKAITLWESLKPFEPSAQFITVIVEPNLTKFQIEEQLSELNFPFDISHPLLAHDIPWNWIDKMKGLSVVEACTAIKASAAKFLLASSLDVQVVYLDPDMQVYGPLNEIDQLLEQSSFVLTPHLIEPPSSEESIVSNEIAGAMVHGIYNLGFFAVKNSREGFEILNWWETRLTRYCKAETEKGIFTDQKWFDIATVYFQGISILKHPGYNVAPWNLGERFMKSENDSILVDNLPLKIFHFSSYDSKVHIEMLEKFDSSRISLQLNEKYKLALRRNLGYKNTKAQLVDQSDIKENLNIKQWMKNLSIHLIKNLIGLLLKNKLVLKLTRQIPKQMKQAIFATITNYINKNLERPRKFTEFNERIAKPPKWVIVTHAGGGGAEQVLRAISKFMNITDASNGVIITPEPEWVQIRLLSGSILYETKREEFDELVTGWINGGSKLVINHVQGHEWWLLNQKWESTQPIVLVHDRAFLRKEFFDPYEGKDLASLDMKLPALNRDKEGDWQTKWNKLLNAAEIILAPSKWIQLEMKEAFSEAKIVYFPWFDSSDRCELPPSKISNTPTIVGIIGATNEHKGINDLKEVSRIALEKNSEIKFILFGHVPPSFEHLVVAKNITKVGQIRRSRLQKAFGDYGISIIWHCSNVQETFSLALSDNIYSGIPLIAKNGGAYVERIVYRDKSWLYEPQMELKHLVDFFMSPDEIEFKQIFPAKNNKSSICRDDAEQIRIFMHKYRLTNMLWLSILGF